MTQATEQPYPSFGAASQTASSSSRSAQIRQSERVRISELLPGVRTRHDLATFVLALREDLLSNGSEWENPSLERFLEAFSAWCLDMPSSSSGQPPEQPNWNLIAQMLVAAAMYE